LHNSPRIFFPFFCPNPHTPTRTHVHTRACTHTHTHQPLTRAFSDCYNSMEGPLIGDNGLSLSQVFPYSPPLFSLSPTTCLAIMSTPRGYTHAHMHTHIHTLTLLISTYVARGLSLAQSWLCNFPECQSVRGLSEVLNAFPFCRVYCLAVCCCGVEVFYPLIGCMPKCVSACFSVVKCGAVRHISFPLTACVCI